MDSDIKKLWVFFSVAVVVLLVLVVWSLLRNYTHETHAGNVKSDPESPTLTDQNNVQSALERLNRVATTGENGMMSGIDKQKLQGVQVNNNGALVFQNKIQACVTVSTNIGTGSGFVIDVSAPYAFIVTAAHVVLENEGSVPGSVPTSLVTVVLGGANGDDSVNVQVGCTVLGYDAAADVAVLQTKSVAEDADTGFDFTASQKILEFTNSDDISPGSDIYCIGDPLGEDLNSICLGTIRDNKYVPSSNSGSIECVSFSAPIAPGNSGGPVLDTNGQVVGMSNFIFTDYPSFGGGVNSHMASQIVGRIGAERGNNDKGYIGVKSSSLLNSSVLNSVRNAFPAFASSEYDKPNGLLIASVEAGMLTAGFSQNDIMLKINDVEVGCFANQYSPTRVTWFASPGTTVKVTCVRPSTAAEIVADVIVSSFPSSADIVLTTAF